MSQTYKIPDQLMAQLGTHASSVEGIAQSVASLLSRETEYLCYRFLLDHPELTIDQCELVSQFCEGGGVRIYVRERQEQAILYGKDRNT
jgi:hypothetical protein